MKYSKELDTFLVPLCDILRAPLWFIFFYHEVHQLHHKVLKGIRNIFSGHV